MNEILLSFEKAFYLIISLDRDLMGIISLSLYVSITAIIIASFTGIVLAYALSFREFPAKGFLLNVLNTLWACRRLLSGCFCILCSRGGGPAGFMGLLYTPSAMIVAQTYWPFP